MNKHEYYCLATVIVLSCIITVNFNIFYCCMVVVRITESVIRVSDYNVLYFTFKQMLKNLKKNPMTLKNYEKVITEKYDCMRNRIQILDSLHTKVENCW